MVREAKRGTDQQQTHLFSYLSPEARVPHDHPKFARDPEHGRPGAGPAVATI